MSASKVATRYAHSLLLLAEEKGQLDKVHEDMLLVKQTATDSKDLRLLLDSPVVKSEMKSNVLKAIFKDKVSDMSMKFIELLVKKRRESLIDNVAIEFENQYLTSKNIITAEVTSVSPLSDAQRTEILAIIKKVDNKEVQLTEKLDPELVGGFIIRIGDRQIDHSVSGKLKAYKAEFTKNHYIADPA